MNELEKQKKRKFPFSEKVFEDEEIIDKDSGYGNFQFIRIREFLGLPFYKLYKDKRTRFKSKDSDKKIGFKNDG